LRSTPAPKVRVGRPRERPDTAGLLFSKVVKRLPLFKLPLQTVLSGRTGEASSISVLDETRRPF